MSSAKSSVSIHPSTLSCVKSSPRSQFQEPITSSPPAISSCAHQESVPSTPNIGTIPLNLSLNVGQAENQTMNQRRKSILDTDWSRKVVIVLIYLLALGDIVVLV